MAESIGQSRPVPGQGVGKPSRRPVYESQESATSEQRNFAVYGSTVRPIPAPSETHKQAGLLLIRVVQAKMERGQRRLLINLLQYLTAITTPLPNPGSQYKRRAGAS
uniref:Uncharacterized protein n=1 Tax=Leersia perrieri TaxID=77586 RepID=A0A0D9X708_9ORYZ